MTHTAKFEKITPDLAKIWLERNKNNRTVINRSLEQLINDMKRDKFLVTGDSIKFDEDGNLLDGQHRLYAIVESGKEVEMLVARGLKKEVFPVIDTGRVRKAGDVLSIDGFNNGARLAALARFVMSFSQGLYGVAAGQGSGGLKKAKFITHSDILNFVHKNQTELMEAIPYGFNSSNKGIVKKKILAGLFYIFNKIDSFQADEFCHKLVNGSDIKAGSPIGVLRQILINDLRSKKHISDMTYLALICKAWNYYRQNKTVTILKWDSLKEPFPKPI